MNILGLETSCDETAAAVVRDGRTILSNVIASQVSVHADFGGVVPELASREHVSNIDFVVQQSLAEASRSDDFSGWEDIHGIAVTQGPGLVGSLLVGISYAKALSYSMGIPLVGVNHLEGHICSIFLDHPNAELPALSLVVSGGHTSLFHWTKLGRYESLARTRDDAAGEALDKLAKFLGLGYPGGPIIDRLAPRGNPEVVRFALPKMSDGSLDFSFSGIKTAALRHVQLEGIAPLPTGSSREPVDVPGPVLDLIASYQRSIVDQLLDRVQRALEGKEVRSIQVSGGVSCNRELRERAKQHFESQGFAVYFPRPILSTDNAAMIAAAGSRRLEHGESDVWEVPVDPNLRLVS